MARMGMKADRRASQNRCHGESILDEHRCKVCNTCNPALIGQPAPDRCAGCGGDLVAQRIELGRSAFVGTFVKTDSSGEKTYRRGRYGKRSSEKTALRKLARPRP